MRVVMAMLIATAVAGCAGTAWPKTAGETTCHEWTSEMTAPQRSALGTAMLLALRQHDGIGVRPREDVLAAYAKALSDICANTPDSKVSAVGATIYGLSSDLKH